METHALQHMLKGPCTGGPLNVSEGTGERRGGDGHGAEGRPISDVPRLLIISFITC